MKIITDSTLDKDIKVIADVSNDSKWFYGIPTWSQAIEFFFFYMFTAFFIFLIICGGIWIVCQLGLLLGIEPA